jgi:nickel/cobalt transporter (NicO) family protein
MIQIIISTFILSAIHAAIPNHWIPLLAVGKAEKWSLKQTLSATIISGFAHTTSTIMIGVMVGFAGYKLSEKYAFITQQLAPLILIGLGLIYILIDRFRDNHNSHQHHEIGAKLRESWSVLFTLTLSMFLTPCVEIEAYYFKAGVFGWKGIMAVSVVYTFTTVILMLFFVFFGFKGTQRLRSHVLEHHEKLIVGIVLIVLGILAFFVKL